MHIHFRWKMSLNIFVCLSRLLPKARVVYCSATGVTDVKNMVPADFDFVTFNLTNMRYQKPLP